MKKRSLIYQSKHHSTPIQQTHYHFHIDGDSRDLTLKEIKRYVESSKKIGKRAKRGLKEIHPNVVQVAKDIKPVIKPVINPITNPIINPVINPVINPIINPTIDQKLNEKTIIKPINPQDIVFINPQDIKYVPSRNTDQKYVINFSSLEMADNATTIPSKVIRSPESIFGWELKPTLVTESKNEVVKTWFTIPDNYTCRQLMINLYFCTQTSEKNIQNPSPSQIFGEVNLSGLKDKLNNKISNIINQITHTKDNNKKDTKIAKLETPPNKIRFQVSAKLVNEKHSDEREALQAESDDLILEKSDNPLYYRSLLKFDPQGSQCPQPFDLVHISIKRLKPSSGNEYDDSVYVTNLSLAL